MPPWHPLLTTLVEAPEAVHPLVEPVSKPPFVIPPPPPPLVVMVRDTLVECTADPSVPVTVSVYVPAAADEVVEMLSVELLPAVTDVGLSEAVTPLGAPETASDTVPALPEVTAVEIVLLPALPAATLTLDGDAEIEKSFEVVPPLTETAELVPLNPTLIVPVAVIVWLPLVFSTTPLNVCAPASVDVNV